MATKIRKVNYVHIKAPNRAGQATRVLTALRNAGVNLRCRAERAGRRAVATRRSAVAPECAPAGRSGRGMTHPQ